MSTRDDIDEPGASPEEAVAAVRRPPRPANPYSLTLPITHKGVQVDDLPWRLARGKDIRATQSIQDEEDRTRALLQRCCDLKPSEYDELAFCDIRALGTLIVGNDPGRPTGEPT